MELKTYLKKRIPGSNIFRNLRRKIIKKAIENLINGHFKFTVFNLATAASAEIIIKLIQEYYLSKPKVCTALKLIDLRHNGYDLSFLKEDFSIFVTISPFDGFFKISVVTFENIQSDVPFTLADFKDKSFFPQKRNQQN